MWKSLLVLVALSAAVPQCIASIGDNQTPKDAGASRPEDVSVCDDCIAVAGALKTALKDAEKLAKFKHELEVLCTLLSPEQALLCREVVEHFDTFVKLLEPYLDHPRQLCQKLHLCPGEENTTPLLIPAPQMAHMMLMHVKRTMSGEQSSASTCVECVLALGELRRIVESDGSMRTVQAALASLCSYALTPSSANTCYSMVQLYVPMAWPMLRAAVSNVHCSQLGFCPVDSEAEAETRMHLRSMIEEASVSLQRRLSDNDELGGFSVTCLLCEVGLRGIVGYLRDSKGILDSIQWGVRWYVCGKLGPLEFNASCSDFLKLYLVPVMQMTLDKLDSDVDAVCTWMHACNDSNNALAAMAVLSESERSWLVCTACKTAAKVVHDELGNVHRQDQLVDYLQHYCKPLIGEWRDECLGLIGSYVPGALQTLADVFYPEYICQEIKLCPLGMEMPANLDEHKLIKTSEGEF